MKNDEDKTIVLQRFLSEFDASLALTKLRSEGIQCELSGSLWPGVLGVPTAGNDGVALLVHESDAHRAREIISGVE